MTGLGNLEPAAIHVTTIWIKKFSTKMCAHAVCIVIDKIKEKAHLEWSNST